MKAALIGRTEMLYETAELLAEEGHEIVLVITAKAAPEYTKDAEDFRLLAERLNVPFAATPRIAEAAELIRSVQPDVGVSMNYPGVIPSSVIELFPLGILNAHGGDLPRYRGNACQAWAILNGEKRIGLCVHKMIGEELDSGDIVAREYYPLNDSTKITAVYEWIGRTTPGLFAQALDALRNNPDFVLERQSPDPADALRCYPRKPEDGRIDWKSSALEILRLINASNRPYAGAYTHYNGKLLRLWSARRGELPCPSLYIPGQILWRNPKDGSVGVGTGADGVLIVEEVQLEGGLPRSAAEIFLSLRDRLGKD